jgi:diguanylate cyclase (GGDEF)-like protein/hemerythrin-like metal-binding protein/PAS domain S-box-containing protein
MSQHAPSASLVSELQNQQTLFESIMAASPDGIVIMDLDGYIRYASAASYRMYHNYPKERIIGSHVGDYMAPEERAHLDEYLAYVRNGGKFGPRILRMIRADGSNIHIETMAERIVNPAGMPIGILSMDRDVTEREKLAAENEAYRKKLEAMTVTDALTGLYNRRFFDEMLDKEYARHARTGGELALILLDVDHFKRYNDTFGHVAGDECLQKIARALVRSVKRPGDIVARYGGEEFVCVLPDTDECGARMIAESIRGTVAAMAIPHAGGDAGDIVTVSLGVHITRCRVDGCPKHTVLDADAQLYLAKERGRNRFEVSCKIPHEPESSLLHLVWRDIYHCGHETLDNQHRNLFSQANELIDAVLAAQNRSTIAQVASRILDALREHFATEEALMREIRYYDYAEHAQEHARLYHKAQELFETYRDGQDDAGPMLQFTVSEVIRQHLFGWDRRYFAEIT